MGMAAVLLLSFLLLAAPAAAINILRRSLAAQTKGDLASITAGNPLVANAMNDRLKNLTDAFAQQMGKEFHYCIKDTDDEWNIAFNFSTDPTFLSNCMQATDGTVLHFNPLLYSSFPPSVLYIEMSIIYYTPLIINFSINIYIRSIGQQETYRSVCAPPLR
jgi:hypothetical protein